MADDKLSPSARAALLVLLASGREVANTQFNELANFRLEKPDRERLNEAGWVKTDTSVKPYLHRLTDKGVQRCQQELTAGPPRRAGSPLVGALYAVLAGVNRHLQRTGGSLADMLAGHAAPTSPVREAAGRTREPVDVEGTVREAYRSLTREPNGWVSLADLRDKISDVPRAAVDDALRRMARDPKVGLIPEADQSSLRPRDHDAAIRIGGEHKHLLSIEGR
jgi:hypothetical protein